MAIQAIETSYAGCRFRSRLEARWAVFLDQLGVTWRYEPQGFQMADGSRYLPDFYLPDERMCVEVKGGETALAGDADRITAFARQGNMRVLVLGDVPQVPNPEYPHSVPVHCVIGRTGVVEYALFTADGISTTVITVRALPRLHASAGLLAGLRASADVEAAYEAARKARFEFGQTPRSPQ